MDARSGMNAQNSGADDNSPARTTTPTWAPSGASPEVLVNNGKATDIPLWRARKRKERNTGLLGTGGLAGDLWIEHCNWIHTFGMRYDIDVGGYSMTCFSVRGSAQGVGKVGLGSWLGQ